MNPLQELQENLDRYASYRHGDVDIHRIRHIVMSTYGFIPEKRFYEEVSIDDLLHLLKEISKDQKEYMTKLDEIRSKTG